MLSPKERLERDLMPQHKGNVHSGPGPQAVEHQHGISQVTLAESCDRHGKKDRKGLGQNAL